MGLSIGKTYPLIKLWDFEARHHTAVGGAFALPGRFCPQSTDPARVFQLIVTAAAAPIRA